MIIKRPQASSLLKDAVVLDLGDLSRQAQRLREAAQAQADKIVREAKEEAARLTAAAHAIGLEEGRSEGHQQGHEQGLAEGKAEALAKTSGDLARVQKLWQAGAADLEGQRQAMQRDARRAVLDLALRMAEKVVHRVIAVDEKVIVDQVSHALSHVLRPLDVVVRISRDDRAVLEDAMPELLADFAQFQHVRLVDDEAIAPGGCVVTYGQGRVDATVRTQLDRITALMLPRGTPLADEADAQAADVPQANATATPAPAAMDDDRDTDSDDASDADDADDKPITHD